MSLSFAFTCTVAPASLHTLAKVRSGPNARDRNFFFARNQSPVKSQTCSRTLSLPRGAPPGGVLPHPHQRVREGERTGPPMNWRTTVRMKWQSCAVQRRLHDRKADRCRLGGASLARATASRSMKSTASGLQRPPVSRATTTSLHLLPWRSSEYFRSLSILAAMHTMPSTTAAPGRGNPVAVRALRSVMSTAS